MWIAMSGFSALCMIGTVVFILFRRRKKDERELFRIRETKFTILLAVLLWTEALAVLYIVFLYPERLISNQNAVFNTLIFVAASVALGCALMLYCMVKLIVVYENTVLYISPLGVERSLDWAKVAKASVSKNLTILEGEGIKIRVRGEKKSFKTFISVLEKKLPKTMIHTIQPGGLG